MRMTVGMTGRTKIIFNPRNKSFVCVHESSSIVTLDASSLKMMCTRYIIWNNSAATLFFCVIFVLA